MSEIRDGWSKADITAKVFAAVALPIILIAISYCFDQRKVQEQRFYQAHQDSLAKLERQADRVTSLIAHISSENELERVVAIRVAEQLASAGHLPPEMLLVLKEIADHGETPRERAAAKAALEKAGQPSTSYEPDPSPSPPAAADSPTPSGGGAESPTKQPEAQTSAPGNFGTISIPPDVRYLWAFIVPYGSTRGVQYGSAMTPDEFHSRFSEIALAACSRGQRLIVTAQDVQNGWQSQRLLHNGQSLSLQTYDDQRQGGQGAEIPLAC